MKQSLLLLQHDSAGWTTVAPRGQRARTMNPRILPRVLLLLAFVSGSIALRASAEDNGVFVRFKMHEPAASKYLVKLGGYIHDDPWHLPTATLPPAAEKTEATRVPAGEWTEWLDLKAVAGKRLHARQNRAGGIAEFPNVTAQFVAEPAAPRRDVEIELATVRDVAKVVKRWREEFEGDLTSFLVSPNLVADVAQLELASEGTERRLRWAREATGGVRHSPKQLLLQTSFWAPQRPELNVREAGILSLLGFNVVGNLPAEAREKFPHFRRPNASHDVLLGPGDDRAAVAAVWEKHATQWKINHDAGAPFNFQDEVCARPRIEKDPKALAHFRQWLAEQKIAPADLGIANLDEVEPIETPEALRERMKNDERLARRVFYYTSRFRQLAATERLLWNSEELHRRIPGALSSTLVADHPYFGGTGLGMGMDEPNTTWGGWPLAMDWFDIGRRRAVDVIGIEDWLGLQFMYGPSYTWEGFQLIGFQAAIFRSASRGEQPIIAWITPSDERNLRLKAASALAQGAKHFFYWTYGPTATSTENYWSDQPGSYPGMAHLSRLLEWAEPILAAGKPRRTKVALLYSISSDLWQPFGYLHMLERRGLYLALIHEQFGVDLLTEEDVAAGRLADYRVLYTADPCITAAAAERIGSWVKEGGTLVGTGAAGTRNEFGEPSDSLGEVFGAKIGEIERQPGEYRVRGRLNDIAHLDRVKFDAGAEFDEFRIIGLKARLQLARAKTFGAFTSDGSPAATEHVFGKGRALLFATTPGISYIKDARFVPDQLAEKWPAPHRRAITLAAHFFAGAAPLVKLSHEVVEAGITDAPDGSALVLANFTYEPIAALAVEMPVRGRITKVSSLAHGALAFELATAEGAAKEAGHSYIARFSLPLGLDDVVLVE